MSGRILVAGIGNIFLGDDAFGVEVARCLLARGVPEGVCVRDFGIRGLDLAFELNGEWSAAILVDATMRGGTPGTLYLIDPELPATEAVSLATNGHGVDPVQVLVLARTMGSLPPVIRVVACEPDSLGSEEELQCGLSSSVSGALQGAVELVDEVIAELSARPAPAPSACRSASPQR